MRNARDVHQRLVVLDIENEVLSDAARSLLEAFDRIMHHTEFGLTHILSIWLW